MLSDEDFHNSKILIVDDDPRNTLLLVHMLEDEGYQSLVVVNDSKKALDLYFEIHPDLVLLDLYMPPPDGFEIMRQLMERDSGSYVPILVLTALRDDQTRLRALSSGAKDFINKPFDLMEARIRIKNLLEMRLLHQKALDQNYNLEKKVKARTAELEQTMKELSDFTYIASHDLQEPLRKITTFGDRLQQKYESALGLQGLDYIQRMQKSAERMSALIDALLDFSRITTDARLFETIDLQEVLQNVLSDLELQIETSEGIVEAKPLPSIEADKIQMGQLFQNLISNGLKYRREGVPPRITIKNELIQENLLEIRVEDNGIGFDEKYLNRIFKPFERLHGIGVFEGTGMGLSICQKIVLCHKGSITAQSVLGQGSTFIVTLPVRVG